MGAYRIGEGGMMARRDAFEFKLVGLKEIDRMLRELPRSTGKAVLRKSLKKAARPIADAYRENIPQSGKARPGKSLADRVEVTSKLKKSQRKKGPRDKTTVELFVGSSSPHAHLVEFGTGPRCQKTTGRHTGQMSPRPYLRQAWDATKGKALEILQDELWENIVKAAKNLRKKAERGTLGARQRRELAAKAGRRWL